jgi:dynein heavy chain, axonemal
MIYFMKPRTTEITMKNITSGIVFGDIVSPQRGLEHMLQVAQEIYLPLVNKQTNLPPSVRKEALSLLHNFLGNAYVLAGQVQGKTLLSTASLPAELLNITNGANGHPGARDEPSDPIAHAMALETCVIQWIQQMKTAIAFAEPPPTATLLIELDFWLDRADNLNTLWEQLDNPHIERVMASLEAAKSTFTFTLRSLRDEVKVARDLANSNANHLRPLRKWLLDMNARASGSDFRDVADTFPPLVHIIYLIWKTSSYYNNNARLVALLQDLCNNVIDLVRSRVSSKNILSQDPTDVVSKLETTIAVCTKLREIVMDYKKKANWDFTSGTALYRLEMMVARYARDSLVV